MAETQTKSIFITQVDFTFAEMIELKTILALRKSALEERLAGLPKEMAASREVVEDWLAKTNGLIKTVEQADRESLLHPRLEASTQ